MCNKCKTSKKHFIWEWFQQLIKTFSLIQLIWRVYLEVTPVVWKDAIINCTSLETILDHLGSKINFILKGWSITVWYKIGIFTQTSNWKIILITFSSMECLRHMDDIPKGDFKFLLIHAVEVLIKNKNFNHCRSCYLQVPKILAIIVVVHN